MKKMSGVLLALVLGCFFILACMWIYFQKSMESFSLDSIQNNNTYAYHYVLIAREGSSPFWQTVYSLTSREAAGSDAYLELIEPDEQSDARDCLRMAIASKVDGIILQPDGSNETLKLIENAKEANIPVVALLSDDASGSRISYVGMNTYELGNIYAETLQDLNVKEGTKVCVLSEDSQQESTCTAICAQIKRYFEQDTVLDISSRCIGDSSDFAAEEAIRDLFLDNENLPDILICMNEVLTECAYQTLVDYNKLDQVTLIGYYYSDQILEAVEKGNMAATIVVDTKDMSKDCVEALTDYRENGRSSDYYSIGINVVTPQNVAGYEAEDEENAG